MCSFANCLHMHTDSTTLRKIKLKMRFTQLKHTLILDDTEGDIRIPDEKIGEKLKMEQAALGRAATATPGMEAAVLSLADEEPTVLNCKPVALESTVEDAVPTVAASFLPPTAEAADKGLSAPAAIPFTLHSGLVYTVLSTLELWSSNPLAATGAMMCNVIGSVRRGDELHVIESHAVPHDQMKVNPDNIIYSQAHPPRNRECPLQPPQHQMLTCLISPRRYRIRISHLVGCAALEVGSARTIRTSSVSLAPSIPKRMAGLSRTTHESARQDAR